MFSRSLHKYFASPTGNNKVSGLDRILVKIARKEILPKERKTNRWVYLHHVR